MLIPFTSPTLRELDSLPVDERARVLRTYATSASAKRLIRVFQASMLVAAVLLVAAINLAGASQVICGIAVPVSLALGICTYRIGATRAIRSILNGSASGD